MCEYCDKRGKTWEGDDPKCAFPVGVFSGDNWNCAGVNLLRKIAGERDLIQYGDDVSLATLRTAELPEENGEIVGGGWVVLSWYKSHGNTATALYIRDGVVVPITETHIAAVLAYYKYYAIINDAGDVIGVTLHGNKYGHTHSNTREISREEYLRLEEEL